MPPSPVPGVPSHLPQRLSICLWIWGWVTSDLPDESYGDLRGAMAGLVERGFNAVRIETGLNWCFRREGTPRGPLAFGPWIAGYSGNLRGVNARGGGRHDVLARLILLLELAREHRVSVILMGYLEFLADVAIRHGYWGYMPTTYCGPDQPLWHQHPGWLRRINRRFQMGESG